MGLRSRLWWPFYYLHFVVLKAFCHHFESTFGVIAYFENPFLPKLELPVWCIEMLLLYLFLSHNALYLFHKTHQSVFFTRWCYHLYVFQQGWSVSFSFLWNDGHYSTTACLVWPYPKDICLYVHLQIVIQIVGDGSQIAASPSWSSCSVKSTSVFYFVFILYRPPSSDLSSELLFTEAFVNTNSSNSHSLTPAPCIFWTFICVYKEKHRWMNGRTVTLQ